MRKDRDLVAERIKMKVSVKKHKKYHRRARTHKAVILKKYGTSIIEPKNKKVKKTYFELIKDFDLEQMAHFLAKFRFINQEQRDVKLIKRILENEAHL